MNESLRAFSFLKMIFLPGTSRQNELYRALGTSNSLGQETMFYNLGYWKNSPNSLDEAGAEMAKLLAQTADLKHSDRALDVGFGLADQDIYWAKNFSPASIDGINICEEQTKVASSRVAASGLSGKIRLHIGDATKLKFPKESFDVVFGLESAFHFSPRTAFFKEAFRVLAPGGRLVLADLCAPAQAGGLRYNLFKNFGRGFWQIPKSNLVSPSEYKSQLEDAGFEEVRIQSIWHDVHPPFARYARARLLDPEVVRRMNPLFRRLMLMSLSGDQKQKAQLMDYVLVVASKPVASKPKVHA